MSGRSGQARENGEMVRVGVVHITASDSPYQMKHYETSIVVDSGVVTVVLPPVAEAMDQTIDISAPAGVTDTVTVTDHNDDTALTDISLDADDDFALLRSNGETWRAFHTVGYS